MKRKLSPSTKGASMRKIALTIMLAMITTSCHRSTNPVVGLWKGEMNGLPAVELAIQGAESQLKGQVTFFFQRMDSGTWKVERQGSQTLDRFPSMENGYSSRYP